MKLNVYDYEIIYNYSYLPLIDNCECWWGCYDLYYKSNYAATPQCTLPIG